MQVEKTKSTKPRQTLKTNSHIAMRAAWLWTTIHHKNRMLNHQKARPVGRALLFIIERILAAIICRLSFSEISTFCFPK